jgi:molybdopterin converting factor small subunit
MFARYADNKTVMTVSGSTIGECLQDMANRYPELGKIILDKNGNLLHSFEVYINGKNAYPDGIKKSISDGDKINVVPVIYGG